MKRIIAIFIVLLVVGMPVFAQKKETYRVRTVVIDPGHGGAKPGAQGKQTQEKVITLAVAKKLGKLIEDNYSGVKVIYTRTSDVDISLAERAHIANSNKADLFISIHANSHPTAAPSGVETFVMGLSESKANLEVAKKENADILLEADYKSNADYNGFDPNAPETYVMLAMFQNSFIDKSLNLAQAIQGQYKQHLKTINRGVKQAELYVLYKTTCPSVLTEIGFISNPTEEAFMISEEGQARIAVCLFNAFMNYKATEEGTDKPLNPVFNIKGYVDPTTTVAEKAKPTIVEKPKESPKPQADKPAKEEPNPTVAEKPKEVPQPVVVEVADTVVVAVEKPKVEVKPTEAVSPKATVAPPATEKPVVSSPSQEVAPSKNVAPIVAEAKPVIDATPQEPAKNAVEVPKQVITPADKPLPSVALPTVQKEDTRQPEPTHSQQRSLVPPKNSASKDAEMYYTVQFMLHPVLFKVGDAALGGIEEFQTFSREQNYVYTTGRFRTSQEAAQYCDHIRETTPFKDAWVTRYKAPRSGVSAPVASQQKEATATTPDKPSASAQSPAKKEAAQSAKVTYRVQFCSSNRRMQAGDPDLQGIRDFHIASSGRTYVYTAGNYPSLKEAQQRMQQIRSNTKFKDAFVIAIYRGERISLEKAAQIEKRNK